jgi:hypothetical protein
MKTLLLALIIPVAAFAQSAEQIKGVTHSTPQDADPGCTTAAHVGKMWFSNATSTSTSKQCRLVSGTPTWIDVPTSGGGGSSPFVLTSANGNNVNTALAALPGGKGTVIVDASLTMSAKISMVTDSTVQCLPGKTITQSNPAVDVFEISGVARVEITGCKTIGGYRGILATNSSFVNIHDNEITGNAFQAINPQSTVTNLTIKHNYIHNSGAEGIFVEDTGANALIAENFIDMVGSTNARGIGVHTYASGGTVSGLTVRDNVIWIAGTTPVFAIEIGKFNLGTIIGGCMVTDNTILAKVDSEGGISMSTTEGCSLLGNHVDMANFAANIAGIENVLSSRTTMQGNHVENSKLNNTALTVNASSYVRIEGNEFNGYSYIENSGISASVPGLAYNDLTHNVFEMPASSTLLPLLQFKCNIASCEGFQNKINENVFKGINLASSVAVKLIEDVATCDGNELLGNTIVNFPSPVYTINPQCSGTRVSFPVSAADQGYISTIASAATISPVTPIVHVTGTTPIDTIALPLGMDATIGGCFTLIADNAWTFTTAGNIFATLQAAIGAQYQVCYTGSKWYFQGGLVTSGPFVPTSNFGGSISLALAALPGGVGTVIVNANTTLTTALNLPSYATVQCLPGFTITQSNPVSVFEISGGTNKTVTGCKMTGGDRALLAYSTLSFSAIDNDISGYTNYGINLGTTSDNSRIIGNRIHDAVAAANSAIFIEDAGSNLAVTGNIIDTTGSSAAARGIAAHTNASGGDLTGLSISGNKIRHAGGNFAIEIGKNNLGNTINGAIVDGNQVIQLAVNEGGIALTGTTFCVVSDSVIYTEGLLANYGSLVAVTSLNTTFKGNQILGAIADSNALTIADSSRSIVDSNQLVGYVRIVGVTTSAVVNDNNFSNNTVSMPVSSTVTSSVQVNCNATGCTALRNRIHDNTFIGQNLGSSVAVEVREDLGTTADTQLQNNTVTAYPSPYLLSAGTSNSMIGNLPTTTGLTWTGVQVIPTGLAAPSIAVGAAAGTTPGTPTVTGFNMAGVVTVITGTSALPSDTLVTVTFNGTLPTAPIACWLFPRNANAAAQAGFIYTTSPSTTSWTIAVGGSAIPDSTTFIWNYSCL